MLIRESSILLLAAALLGVPLTVSAQAKGGDKGGGGASTESLITRYSPLAGSWAPSNANATSLVNGLRSGSQISLYGPLLELKSEPTAPTSTTKPRPCIPTQFKPCPPATPAPAPKQVIVMDTITFTSPIGGTGVGGVDIALALAQGDATKNQKLTLPLTPEQLKAALLGGTVRTAPGASSRVTFTGVLVLRGQGGWGEVAKALNLELN
jgi:hypothetical protein